MQPLSAPGVLVSDGAPTSFEAQFEALFRAYAPYVRRVAPRMGVADRDVDDVVQEVFLAVHRGLSGFENRSSPRTWIYGICIRVCANHRRKAHRRRERLHDEMPESRDVHTPEQRTSARQALAVMDRALGELNEGQRATFVLHEIEQLSVSEISQALGVSKFTLYARLTRSRKHVRAAIVRAQSGEEAQDG